MELNEFGHNDAPFIPVATPIDGPVEPPEPSDPMLLERMSRARAMAHLAILTVVFVALQVVVIVGFVVSKGGNVSEEELTKSVVPLVITVAVGLVLVFCALGLTWNASCSAASIGLSFSRWHIDCLWGIVVAVASQVAFFVTMMVIFVIWPGMREQMEANPDRISEMLPPMHPALLVGLIALVAFWEEAIFRGVLVTHLRRATGNWIVATLVGGCLFGAMHINIQEPIMAVPLAVIGVIWTLFMIWRRSIVACVVGHALFNLGQLFMLGHLTNSAPTP